MEQSAVSIITTVGSVFVSILTIYLKHRSDTDKTKENARTECDQRIEQYRQGTKATMETLRAEVEASKTTAVEAVTSETVIREGARTLTRQLRRAGIEPLWNLPSEKGVD